MDCWAKKPQTRAKAEQKIIVPVDIIFLLVKKVRQGLAKQ